MPCFAASPSPPLAARRRARSARARRRRQPEHAAAAQPDPPPPVKPPEVSPKDRAALHADLGAGYYERGQMDVALEELNEAAKLDPSNPPHLQHLRPRLRDAGREREGGTEFPARARARAGGLRHPPQLGLVPLQQRPSARVDRRIRDGVAQSAVQDAGDRARSTPDVAAPRRRQRRRRGVLPARAGALTEQRARARTGSRCIAYRAGRWTTRAAGCGA